MQAANVYRSGFFLFYFSMNTSVVVQGEHAKCRLIKTIF